MTNRKKAARLKEDLLQQRHAHEAEMSSTKAWLFLEHLSATPGKKALFFMLVPLENQMSVKKSLQ